MPQIQGGRVERLAIDLEACQVTPLDREHDLLEWQNQVGLCWRAVGGAWCDIRVALDRENRLTAWVQKVNDKLFGSAGVVRPVN